MPLLGGTKPAEVPPEPVPESVLNTIEWTKGYGHIISGHPHCGVLTNDGGVMIVGDCANYYQDENGGDVGTGKHWPRSLIRAILVTKVSKDGDEEWSYRYDNGVGRNYGKYGCALADGTLLVCGATSMVDPVGSAAGFACVQRGVLLRLSASGDLLSELIFPFSGGAEQPGRREGCMCVTPGEASDVEMVVYVTGYLRSECGYDPSTHEYDDDPMFLITLGHAFIRRLVFRSTAPNEPPRQEGLLVLTPDTVGGSLAYRQGMRVRYDAARSQVVILAVVTTHADTYEPHFGAVAVDAANVTDIRWYRLYGSDGSVDFHASHPYAMCLTGGSGGGGGRCDGYVFAGHSYHAERSEHRPVGRALKVDPTDGAEIWEAAFAQPGLLLNTECYGVCETPAGLLLTCGTGAHHDDACDAENVWRCLVVLIADGTGGKGGTVRIVQPYTSNEPDAGGNNAGEYVLATPDGGAIVVIDSQSFGPPHTGGNFALMKIKPEALRAGLYD